MLHPNHLNNAVAFPSFSAIFTGEVVFSILRIQSILADSHCTHLASVGLSNILVAFVPQLVKLLCPIDQLFSGPVEVELISPSNSLGRLSVQPPGHILEAKGVPPEFASLIFLV